MTIKLTLSVVFALLSGGIFLENYTGAKDAAHNISQSPINEDEISIFQPRARSEDEKYGGRMIGAPTFASGGCSDTEPPPLTVLVPGNGEETFRSITAKPDPMFWFYIPYPSDSNLPAKFELRQENNTTVWVQEDQLSIKGIFRIQLPEKLELDKNYYWNLKIICDQTRRDLDIYVDGYVKREKATSSPPNITPEQIASFYAQDGLWHEALTTYIEDVCPQNAQIARSGITANLKSEFVGLERYAENYVTAIIEYCNPNSLQVSAEKFF